MLFTGTPVARVLGSRSHPKAGRSFSFSIARAELDRSCANTRSALTGVSRFIRPALQHRGCFQRSSKDAILRVRSVRPSVGP